MKLYTLKFTLALIFIYAIFASVVVFFYTTTSRQFLENRSMENVQNISEAVATRLDSQLLFDFDRYELIIDTYLSLSLDPYESLKDDQSSIVVGTITFSFFGYLDDQSIIIDDETYTFKEQFTTMDYNQPVAFYALSEALNEPVDDDTVYMVFMHEGIFAYAPAYEYILPLLASASSIDRDFFIMGSDNLILIQDPTYTNNKFFDLLRASDVEEVHIDNIKENIDQNESFVYKTAMFSEGVFAAFTPLSLELSTRNLYLVQTFNLEQALQSFELLTYTLWAVFAVTFFIFVIALFVLHHITASQMIEVEGSRLIHYYDKPYIIKINKAGRVKYFNKRFKQLVESHSSYKSIKSFDIITRDHIDDHKDFLQKQHAFTVKFDVNGDFRYVHFVNLKSRGGYLLAGDNLTDVQGRADDLYELAMINALTKIPNKNKLLRDLSDLIKADACDGNCSLAAFEVVSFSKINLLMNEKLGDQMLVMIKEIASKSLEKYEATLYNTSLDQFVILFRNLPDFKWANEWARNFIETMNSPIQIDKNILEIEIEIGLFHIEKDKYVNLNAQTSYDNVILAMNHAKQSASTQLKVYDIGLTHFASREEMMEKDLAKAIVDNEFEMHLQPQYHNLENKIVGFEALIRWKNPKYSKESPQKFIELAERNNMIIEIGRIALHETFTIAKEFEDYDIDISINISPVQLLQAGFVTDLIAIFEQYDLKKGSISLEITETFLMTSFDLIIQKLKAFQDYGFDLHLDDFGTGYSSLQYLRDLPVSTIKIDRAFVKNMHLDRHSRAIVQMISSLAKNVGLQVIAEGVENEKENQALIKAGCNIIQGYWISPPVPKDEAKKLLEEKNGKIGDVRKLRR
ncbi:MAG: putative bifunctional diguanylate cyclase/phosphodiesterase [Acholeplasmataceae bacterium]